ncbi:MAG: TRAP transporter substrate-binding protein [Rhodomicrobium sp.]|nr:TRAP transporter substrate-binding protein [Rhodomicrobium sp.]
MLRPAGLIFLLAVVALFAPGQSSAQQRLSADPYAQAGQWTLGMMTGAIDGTALRMANELAVLLDDGPNLRIVPMIGESSIRNVTDLFHVDGVDLAVVQSDVLAHLKRTNRIPGLEDRMHYIAKLHSEEFHVLSRMKFLCLADLSGRKVNFGPAGSGSALTAQAVFEASKVQVQPQYLDQTVAAQKLRNGEIDAAVFVSGKPASAFDRLRYTDGVHFLDVGFVDDLQRDYLPAILTHDDYPDLVAPDETVSTIAVSAVVAAAKPQARNRRPAKLDRFVERFFSRLQVLRQPPNHVKWREVSLSAPVAGWTRFPAAQQWLKDNPASSAAKKEIGPGAEPDVAGLQDFRGLNEAESEKIRFLFEKFSRDYGPSSGEDRDKLFKEFLRWYSAGKQN